MTIKLKPKEDSSISFEQWAYAKYQEISKNINPCDANGKLDPLRLNEVLTQFSGHFAWAITIQETESNRLNILNHEFENWYKEKYNEAFRLMREENGGQGRVPGQTTIEARIVELHGDELKRRKDAIENQRSRVELLRGFVKVLDRQASILQTLSSNMRSELFFAAGVSVKENLSPDQKAHASKLLVHSAMRGQGQKAEGSE